MNKKQEQVQVRSLPPVIDGEVNGYLTMKVDEIVWHREPCVNAVVLVQWWGENEPSVFRPVNVISSLSGVVTNTTVSYEIRTTVCLFEEYLKDCEVLDLYVTDERLSTVIGRVTVHELFTLIRENPYHCYLPIMNTFGSRIGDLHVGFMVQFIHQSRNVHYFAHGIASDEMSVNEMSKKKAVEYEENDVDGLSHCRAHSKSLLKCKILPTDTLPYAYDDCKSRQSRGAQPISDSVISDILERGQKLRDAMIRSVLEDDTELVANDFDTGIRHCDSSADKIVDTWTEDRNVYFDDAEVMEFLSGKSMTRQAEECAMERLKNMSPVTSLWEMAEELGGGKDFIIKDNKGLEGKCSKLAEPELEADLESSVPAEEATSNKNTAVRKEVTTELLWSETVLRDCLVNNVDSLQITVHTLAINNTGKHRYQNCVQSGFPLTQSGTRRLNLLHKPSEQHGTFYFVEYELPGVKRVTQDLSRRVKETRPWHTSVKRICSRKKAGSGICFEQSSLHDVPTSKVSLHKFLRDGNIMFRIYCRTLDQRIPTQVGEAHLRMTDILKSETFSLCKDVEVVYRTKIPECPVVIGLLKVTVKLGARQKHFGSDILDKLNKEFLSSNAGSSCMSRKRDSEASLRHVSDPIPAPRSEGFDISRRIFKNNGKKIMSCDVSKEQEFCKNDQQKIELDGEVAYPSLREVIVNKPVLLHGLLHISQGRGYDGLNSYLICRTFWKDDIMTSDICCKTGNPYYNFHELIPVMLSADMLERSHNNVFAVEVWKRFAARSDTLIGVARLPLNKFFIAYRDPVVATQLLLSKYPVIGVDGWVRVQNPVTCLLSGHLRALLALGTEDQVQLLEVTRGLKEAVFTHTSQDFQDPMQAACGDSNIIQTTSVGEPVSLEPCSITNRHRAFSYSVVNHHESSLLGQSASQTRHIRNNLSEIPENLYDHAHALESLQSYCYDNSDNVPLLDVQEDVTSLSVDVSDLTGSLPSVSSVLYRTVFQEGKIDGVEFQGNSHVDVARHTSFKKSETEKSNGKKPHSSLSEGSAVSSECPTVRREKCTQEPNFQSATDHCDVGSLGTKEFYQSVVDRQVKPSQRHQSSQAGAGLKTHGTINSKIDSCLSSDKQDVGISSKHQESQTDLELTSSETFTLQNSLKTTKGEKCKLPRSPPGDVICEACISSNEVSNVQADDFSNSKNSSVGHKELSCQCTQTLSPFFAEPNTTSESCTEAGIIESCSESPRPGLNAESFPGIVNQTSKTEQSSSLFHELLPSQPAEFEPEDRFHAHLEIERALRLRCFTEHDDCETAAGTAFAPSTYVSFVLKQGCPTTNESDLKMFTPIVPHSASPVWHWPCHTWLPSDLLTDNSKCMIFEVWQSANGSCRDPERDTVLGFAAVDLNVLLFGMPSVSGWFNIMDFAGQCSGQIKINITPLEDLSRFNQHKTSSPKMLSKLQENCYSMCHSSNKDCKQTACEKCNCKATVAATASHDAHYSSYDGCHVQSETSTKTLPSQVTDTHEVLLHHTSNTSNDVTDHSVKCDEGSQDMSSHLSQVLMQKLSELDEITQRLKKRLHVVTNEGFTAPCLSSMHETENSFRPEAASHTVSNTKGGKSTETAAVSSVNKKAYEGSSVLKITNFSEVAVGCSKLSVNKSGTEGSHVKVAEQNYEVPILFSQGCENVTSSIICSLPINNFAGLSSTSTNSLPQSDVTNSQTRLGKGSENVIATKTSVNHTSSLADTRYLKDIGSHSKTSSRTCGCELVDIWNEGVSKSESNGPSLQHVDMRLQFEHADDSYGPSDYLMEMCARHLEVDSVFNPLLFHQLLSSCNKLNISGFNSEHDVECHYHSEGGNSAEPSSGTIESCSGGGAAALVNVNTTECLMYSPKELTHTRNDRLCVNSNSGNCDVNRARTEETEENVNKISENAEEQMG